MKITNTSILFPILISINTNAAAIWLFSTGLTDIAGFATYRKS